MADSTKEPVILFRAGDQESEDEMAIASAAAGLTEGLRVTQSRVGLRDKLVIGRYSVLPYYKELEADLQSQGSRLANSPRQHEYVAEFEWYRDIEGMTPKTWFTTLSMPKGPGDGPFVVKGLTNSRKFEWDTMMYAPTYQDVLRIISLLGQDGLIG